MYTRRHFATLFFGGVLGASVLLGPLSAAARWAWAATRKVLTKATTRASLIHENPADLDTTNLALTPLDAFETMGETDRVVDLATWRLEIAGLVRQPLKFMYSQLTALPSIEREVLLICPGFFANHGRWKGFSIATLLRQADVDPKATHVVIAETGGKTAAIPWRMSSRAKCFWRTRSMARRCPANTAFPCGWSPKTIMAANG